MASWREQEKRIREVYARRDAEGKRSLSHADRPEMRIWRAEREEVARRLLQLGGIDLRSAHVLDVGCGAGDWLSTLAEWGTPSERLHGIDLLQDRIETARAALPDADLQVGSGWALPFPDGSMHLVCANTVLSSIREADARRALAEEMRRVLGPSGALLIYDFRISHPLNPETVGVGRSTVRELFQPMEVVTGTLTLAPPLARPLAALSPGMTRAVGAAMPFLRTHAMHLVRTPA